MRKNARLVLSPQGLLQLRTCVSYYGNARMYAAGATSKVPTFWLSVYVRTFVNITLRGGADVQTWELGERLVVPRTVPPDEQQKLIDALCFKVASKLNRDYVVVEKGSMRPSMKERDDGL